MSAILISGQLKLFSCSVTPYSVFYSVPLLGVIPDMILSKQVPSEDRVNQMFTLHNLEESNMI